MPSTSKIPPRLTRSAKGKERAKDVEQASVTEDVEDAGTIVPYGEFELWPEASDTEPTHFLTRGDIIQPAKSVYPFVGEAPKVSMLKKWDENSRSRSCAKDLTSLLMSAPSS